MKKSEPPKIWDEWKKHLEDFDLPSNALRRKGGKALKPQKSQLKVTIRRSQLITI